MRTSDLRPRSRSVWHAAFGCPGRDSNPHGPEGPAGVGPAAGMPLVFSGALKCAGRVLWHLRANRMTAPVAPVSPRAFAAMFTATTSSEWRLPRQSGLVARVGFLETMQ